MEQTMLLVEKKIEELVFLGQNNVAYLKISYTFIVVKIVTKIDEVVEQKGF